MNVRPRPLFAAVVAPVLVLVAGLVAACTAAAATARPPNIVFILADDLGIHDLAADGRTDHRTPALDRLAREGTRFTSAYCAQPICSPSRAAILTGRSPARLHLTTYLPGRADNAAQSLLHPAIQQQLPLAEVTLAERLRDAGYATACMGKWHLGGNGFGPAEQGFDFVHPGKATTPPSATEGSKGEFDLTAASLRFISTNSHRPFFLYLAHNSPHIPFASDPDRIARNQTAFDPTYAAVVETLDESVGRLLNHLDTLGLRDRTIVVFTSDNGGLHVPELRHRRVTHNGPYRAGKGFLYEGGLRIPLIVRWPGRIAAGRVVSSPVINTAWTPTLLELAGLPAPAPDAFDARSFARVLRSRFGRAEPPLYWHFPHYTNQGGQPGGAMRDGPWKLIEFYEDQRCELYRLDLDPGEAVDLARQLTERVASMRSKLAAWRTAMGAQTNAPNPAFNPTLHRQLYDDFVPSRFSPATATPAEWSAVQTWRERMDAVTR